MRKLTILLLLLNPKTGDESENIREVRIVTIKRRTQVGIGILSSFYGTCPIQRMDWKVPQEEKNKIIWHNICFIYC